MRSLPNHAATIPARRTTQGSRPGRRIPMTATTTNASGAYSFGNLRPGTYTLTETQPAGLLDGKDTAGSLGGVATTTVRRGGPIRTAIMSRSMNSPWDLTPEPFAASPCLQPTRCNNAG